MILDNTKTVLIVGLGLMGGSYAMALKRKGFRVTAVTLDEESIDYALKKGLIDKGSTSPDPALLAEADLVVFALYPRVLVNWIEENQGGFKPGTLLTDVTGVKGTVVYDVQRLLRPDLEFVPAHPMTGREVYGVKNSTDRSFKEANYIVTPTDKNTPEGIEAVKELGRILGFARISVLSPEEHDEIIAFVSQLAHCLAIVLMTCNDLEHLEDYTGNSFRDLTRIAHINENMWSELFMMNREALLREMTLFEEQFTRLKHQLQTGDVEAMKEMMRRSTERRDAFDLPKRP